MKKRQRKVRLIRAAVQLAFFIVAPALFSTAFAGIKSIFQAIASYQPVTWNSFLDVTGALLLLTILFGRHFCGYACAFGSLGDALYEVTLFVRRKVFHKKKRHGYSEKIVRILQKVKYILLTFILLSILVGWYTKITGYEPLGRFFHAYSTETSQYFLQDRDHSADPDPDRHVHTGKIFLSVFVSDGSNFCHDAHSAICIIQKEPGKMPGKMRSLQEKVPGTS